MLQTCLRRINIFDEYLYRNVNEEKVSSATNIDVINPTEANIVLDLEYNENKHKRSNDNCYNRVVIERGDYV